jgi:hypothetical protein
MRITGPANGFTRSIRDQAASKIAWLPLMRLRAFLFVAAAMQSQEDPLPIVSNLIADDHSSPSPP